MSVRWIAILALGGLLTGCQHATHRAQSSTPVSAVDASSPAECQLTAGERVVVRPLRNGETISGVLDDVLPPTRDEAHRTIVLLRRSPEGHTQELIDVDAAGRLVDPSKDMVLRDGDELILPARPTVPVGLERPPVLSAETPQ